MHGKKAQEYLAAHVPPTIAPRIAVQHIARSWDIGYAFGHIRVPGTTRPVASFLTIWKLDKNEKPRLVLDLENEISAEQNRPFIDLLERRSLYIDDLKGMPGNVKEPFWAFSRTDLQWHANQTALLICDVWDKHWCPAASVRLDALVPRMNKVVEEARRKGVLIIHAPSECMKFYEGTPQRKLAQAAPKAANLPKEIDKWLSRLPDEPKLPIDDSDGGCDSDQPVKPHQAWTRQHAGIRIADGDAVSDSGVEIWNLLEQRGLKNVMILGVHTNMCVLGRPFGLRQMARNGKNVVLVRDLTDAMYNPKMPPHVSHERGTELVIEHIERYVCGTIHSADILGERQQPHMVFVIGEGEYQTEKTLPEFARQELQPHDLRCTFVHADAKNPNEFPGLEAIKDADLVVLSVRRRALQEKQLALIRQYLEAGKPLVAIRTASHAFDPKPPGQGASWPTFDVEVLGGKYLGHYGSNPPQAPSITFAPAAKSHPILQSFDTQGFRAASHLYKNRDLAKTATPLLMGALDGQAMPEPVAWTNTYKGGRIFYTSLGSPGDFALPSFRLLLRNAVFWALERPLPAKK